MPKINYKQPTAYDKLPQYYTKALDSILSSFTFEPAQAHVRQALLTYFRPALAVEQERLRCVSRNETRLSTYGVAMTGLGFIMMNARGSRLDQEAIENAQVDLSEIAKLVEEILVDSVAAKSKEKTTNEMEDIALKAIQFKLKAKIAEAEAIQAVEERQDDVSIVAEVAHAFLPARAARVLSGSLGLQTREDISREVLADSVREDANKQAKPRFTPS